MRWLGALFMVAILLRALVDALDGRWWAMADDLIIALLAGALLTCIHALRDWKGK